MYLIINKDKKLMFDNTDAIVKYCINKDHWKFEFYKLSSNSEFKPFYHNTINIKAAKIEWEQNNE